MFAETGTGRDHLHYGLERFHLAFGRLEEL